MLLMMLMMFRDILVTILLVYWYTGYNSTGILVTILLVYWLQFYYYTGILVTILLVYWLQLDCTNQYTGYS